MIIIIIKYIGQFRLYASPMFLVPRSWSHPPCGMVQRTQVQRSHSTSTIAIGWLVGWGHQKILYRCLHQNNEAIANPHETYWKGQKHLPGRTRLSSSSNYVLAASSMFCCLLHAGTLWSLSFCRCTAILCLFLSPLFSPLLFRWISR